MVGTEPENILESVKYILKFCSRILIYIHFGLQVQFCIKKKVHPNRKQQNYILSQSGDPFLRTRFIS